MNGVNKINKRLKRCSSEYRKSLYAANLDVTHFVKIRQFALCTLMVLLGLHEITNIALIIQEVASTQYLGTNIAKLTVYLVLLNLPFLGNWKASLGLYLIAIPTLISFAASWSAIRSIDYTIFPLLLVLVIIEVLFTVLVVPVTLWLSVSPKSHRLADKDREIRLDYIRFINENMTAMADE